MAKAPPEVENNSRAPRDEQRGEPLRAMVAELDGPSEPEPDVAGVWLDEAERRDREIDSGAVESIPGEEVFRDAAQLLRR
jgi:hypothetical protein